VKQKKESAANKLLRELLRTDTSNSSSGYASSHFRFQGEKEWDSIEEEVSQRTGSMAISINCEKIGKNLQQLSIAQQLQIKPESFPAGDSLLSSKGKSSLSIGSSESGVIDSFTFISIGTPHTRESFSPQSSKKTTELVNPSSQTDDKQLDDLLSMPTTTQPKPQDLDRSSKDTSKESTPAQQEDLETWLESVIWNDSSFVFVFWLFIACDL